MTNNQLAENSVNQLLNSVRLARDNAERADNRVDHSFYYALTIALEELQERRKTSAPELNPAKLANKFYERYPLATFKSDSERAEAFGYFMAGAELQCFGEFIKYEDLCGDE